LIVAAIYAGTTHRLEIALIVLTAATAAILGDNGGFAVGHWGGFRLLVRYGRYIRFDQRRLKIGRYVFRRHGGKVVFFGRFVAVLRTWAAFLAGTNRMPWPRFLFFNACGGIVWATANGLAYYYLGSSLKQVRTSVDLALGAAASVLVVAFLLYLRRAERRYAALAEEAFPGPIEDHFPSSRSLGEEA